MRDFAQCGHLLTKYMPICSVLQQHTGKHYRHIECETAFDCSPMQNPALAIFTLIGSQLLGYGYAGLLQDMLVKPTKCFWPTTSMSLYGLSVTGAADAPQSPLPTFSRRFTSTTK